MAAEHGHTEVVDTLIKANAKVDCICKVSHVHSFMLIYVAKHILASKVIILHMRVTE